MLEVKGEKYICCDFLFRNRRKEKEKAKRNKKLLFRFHLSLPLPQLPLISFFFVFCFSPARVRLQVGLWKVGEEGAFGFFGKLTEKGLGINRKKKVEKDRGFSLSKKLFFSSQTTSGLSGVAGPGVAGAPPTALSAALAASTVGLPGAAFLRPSEPSAARREPISLGAVVPTTIDEA
jgi:hypothetical protein